MIARGQTVPDERHAIARLCRRDFSDIDHHHVHANGAHNRRARTANNNESAALRQRPRKAVGVPNRQPRDSRGPRRDEPPAI